MKKFREEQGFTLIELMVVILIIGILVAIAIPVFNTSRDAAYQKTCQANLRTIDGAIQAYRADTGALPTSLSDLEGSYLKSIPTCPEQPADPYRIDTTTAGDTAECPSHKGDNPRPHVLQ